METLIERIRGISIVGGGEEVTTGEDIDKGNRVGKEEPLGSRVYSDIQSLADSVGKKRQEVHLEMTILEGRVSRDEKREVRVAVEVREGELIVCDKWVCKWEERTEERRQRDGVSYSLLKRTLHVSTPT